MVVCFFLCILKGDIELIIRAGITYLLLAFTSVFSIPVFANSLSNIATTTWDASYSAPFDVVVDNSGNVFLRGLVIGTSDLDPTDGVDMASRVLGGEFYITKLNADGSYGWSRVISTRTYDPTMFMAINANGDIFVTGKFWGTVDFDPTGGEDIHKTFCATNSCSFVSTTSQGDIFLSKINSDGSYGWTRTFGGKDRESVDGIAVDNMGDIHLAGSFLSTVDFDPTEGVDNRDWTFGRDANGLVNADLFITRINADSSYGGVRILGTDGLEQSTGIAVDINNNIFNMGYFVGELDFDHGAGVDIRSNSDGIGFITKTDNNGIYQWTRQFKTFELNKVDTDSNGNVYIAGKFIDTVDFDPSTAIDYHTSNGSWDIFVTKLNADGSYAWTETFGDIGRDEAYALVVNADGHVYVTGYLSDVTYVAGTGTIYIASINPSGILQSTNEMQGSGTGRGAGIALDQNDIVYIAGSFNGTVDFDPGPGDASETTSGPFYAKYASANERPTAEAGSNQMIHPGGIVYLNGGNSTDDNTATGDLQYAWSFDGVPVGSTVAFDNANIQEPTFIADKLGTYSVSLVVTDEGGLASASDKVEFSSENVPPNANSGPGQGVYVGDLVVLDGSSSNDSNFDPLTYSWELVSKPTSPASVATLFDSTTAAPYFTPDVVGEYEVELTVFDGFDYSAPHSVIITAVSASSLINDARNVINNEIPSSCFKNNGDKISMDKHLRNALKALANDNTGKAITDVTKAIKVTDGCASNDPLRGKPDEENGPTYSWVKDSIISCPHQTLVYPLLEEVLNGLQP